MKVKNPDEIREDILLIQKTLLGDQSAFEKLVRKYRPAIYALVLSYVKNAADAEDLTQEVFIKAYQNLVCLKNLGQFPFWLSQIARNHCKNWLNRRGEMPVSFEEIKVAPSANMMSSPEEMVLKQELRDIVWQAIDSLLEVDRKLLEARYMEDASLKQLQAAYSLSYPAIVNRLKRAKQKVRQQVQKILGGFCILPGREALEKIFLGGIEVVKLSLKTKLVTVATVVALGLGGTGVWYWHSKSAPQKSTVVHQQETKSKKATSASAEKKVVIPKSMSKVVQQAQPAQPPVQTEEKQEEISDEETEFEPRPAEMKQAESQKVTQGEVKEEEQSPESEDSEEIKKAWQEYLELCAQRKALEDERDALREWARQNWDNLTEKEQEEIMLKQDALFRQASAYIPRLNELHRFLKLPPFDK